MRFGIEMNTDHTLEEVGKQFDVTREHHPPDRSQGPAQATPPDPLRTSCAASSTPTTTKFPGL